MENLKQMLENTYKNYGNNVAYKLENRDILYTQSIQEINALGTRLISLGLKNKKIGIIAENRYEWEVAYFSIICGTGVVVPIDKSLPKNEIERIIKRADIEALFCSDKYIDNYENLKYIISMDLDKSNDNILAQKELIREGKSLLEFGITDFVKAKIDSNQLATIIFTSGTTDTSKAVMLSHKNICSNLNNVSEIYDITEKEVTLSILPLNHVLEGLFCMLLSIKNGATRVYCNSIEKIAEYMKKYKVTFMGGVPAIYRVIYDDIDTSISENINFLFSAGAYLSPEIIKKYESKNIKLLQGYGMTETSSAVALETKEKYKIGSCGKTIPKVEIQLQNINEDGIGELATKSNCIMIGYYKYEENTINDDWFLTGDLAKIDEEGYIYICGRTKNIIVLDNGKKVFPEEIEEKINNSDIVKESIIFEKDNKICVKIVCNKDKEENILNLIEEINQTLPMYKQINKIYLTEEKFERNNLGKIKRKEEIEKTLSQINKEKSNIDGNNIEDTIRLIISEQLDVDISKITNEANLINDLMADSLDKVEMIIKIGKALDIKIPKEEYSNFNKVEDFIKYINRLV